MLIQIKRVREYDFVKDGVEDSKVKIDVGMVPNYSDAKERAESDAKPSE